MIIEQKTAVVIDDEEDITTFLSSILEDNGFTVRTANDAKTGEDLVRADQPSIVLIDLMMPGRSGVQLFARLRGDSATSEIPIVMVTGIKEEMGIDWGEIVDKLKARKPDGFIEKPIVPERIISVVNGVLSGRTPDGEVLHG